MKAVNETFFFSEKGDVALNQLNHTFEYSGKGIDTKSAESPLLAFFRASILRRKGVQHGAR